VAAAANIPTAVPRTLRRVCVFCGSNPGSSSEYRSMATRLGSLLAARGIGLVFGGGSVGMMGAVADAAAAGGAETIGIIPEGLAAREVAHRGVTEMHVVTTMHQRKALMSELSDAFIALPGGFGTLEELFEVTTWAQLGIHRKPIGLLDINGYYRQLVSFIDHAVKEQFIRREYRDLFVVGEDPETLLDTLTTHEMPVVARWVTARET
jgi:uncharacterized protein (TIGR00730 family)